MNTFDAPERDANTSAIPRLTWPMKRFANEPWNVSWPSNRNEMIPLLLSTSISTVVQMLPGEPAIVAGGDGKSDW
jgi:hypothetical protein